MTILGKGVGVLMKTSGSGSPTFVLQDIPEPPEVTYPFKVMVRKAAAGYDVYVMPGTANNRMPKIGTAYLDATIAPKINFTSVSATGKKIVALKVTYSTATFFPDASEIVLLDDEESLTDSNTYGYLQIASITCSTVDGNLKVNSVNQYIHASQIVVRAKPGSGTATWSFLSR